jgi:hypothetical protein
MMFLNEELSKKQQLVSEEALNTAAMILQDGIDAYESQDPQQGTAVLLALALTIQAFEGRMKELETRLKAVDPQFASELDEDFAADLEFSAEEANDRPLSSLPRDYDCGDPNCWACTPGREERAGVRKVYDIGARVRSVQHWDWTAGRDGVVVDQDEYGVLVKFDGDDGEGHSGDREPEGNNQHWWVDHSQLIETVEYDPDAELRAAIASLNG